MRWFGHVQQRPMTTPVRKTETIEIDGCKRIRGRPKFTWVELVRSDIAAYELTIDMALDRGEWRNRIRVVNHT